MKELVISIPEDAIEFVEEFVERIGGVISSNNLGVKEKGTKTLPLDFFGTWLDIPLDPKTYRKKAWRKTSEL